MFPRLYDKRHKNFLTLNGIYMFNTHCRKRVLEYKCLYSNKILSVNF